MSTATPPVAVEDGVDAGLPWHFGDPLGEQRALVQRAGVVDRGNRDVVMVTGADRLPWLHSICSQHVADLTDGDSVESLVLSPHGHVEQHWQLTELDGAVWIDTEPGAAAAVVEYLQKMRFLKRVEPADVSANWAVVSVVGPATGAVLAAAELPSSQPGRATALPPGSGYAGFVRGRAGLGQPAVDLLVERADALSLIDRLRAAGAERAGTWAYEAVRVAAGQPRLGFETDHRTIPHEVGWIGTAVHLDKGCYRGQETVARVQNLGRPPRRLVLVHLAGDSDDLPPPGTPVLLGGRPVGFLGTAVQHHELGPIALAVVKRTLSADAELTVAGSPITLAD